MKSLNLCLATILTATAYKFGKTYSKQQSEKYVINAVLKDLGSQGRLARALEKWIVQNECLRVAFRVSHQKEPISPLGQTASAYLHRDRHPNKR